MWDEKYRTIERSKPNARPVPGNRVDGLRRLVDPRRLFRKSSHLYIGFAVFFVLGTLIGMLLGSSGPPKEPALEKAARTGTESKPAAIGRPDLKVRAYAYTTRSTRETPVRDRVISSTAVEAQESALDIAPKRPRERPSVGATIQGEAGPEVEMTVNGEEPAWLAFAAPATGSVGSQAPLIAIVIDDLGIDQNRTRRAIALPPPMTMAFLPYGYNLAELTKSARNSGHELIVHLPMQPTDSETDPGPNALLLSLGPEEIRERIRWNLSRFEGFVGVNNHMGSGFTGWDAGMAIALKDFKRRGLLYLDSLTSGASVASKISSGIDLPFAIRDVFLDNDPSDEKIRAQLDTLERIARQRGHAIGIGHPYDSTISVVNAWIGAAKARGINFVPLSEIVRRRHFYDGKNSPPVSLPEGTPAPSGAG